ncbi:cupin domain-containing protein [Leucobacter weissii]|uniref:Cupin domain-containing protein n=1 Tax=Leucobacter weissii TaxID=1983706 RepID=A0A939SAP1_9MICO|nr:cupin domain-containing protein [Leucobacter weissii]MBO1900670.1 cupin domain-containing protein [Leucobacter weissii]
MTELLPGGQNGVVHGRGAIVPLEPVPAAEIDHGSPRQGAIDLGAIGGAEVGIWELRDGAVVDTEIDELFVVISGGATVELLDEGRSVDVKTGDVMRLTAGTRTRWTVEDHIRKVYLAAE